jgi:hypothetical protein
MGMVWVDFVPLGGLLVLMFAHTAGSCLGAALYRGGGGNHILLGPCINELMMVCQLVGVRVSEF